MSSARAQELAEQGLKLWGEGRLEEAATALRGAISLVPADDFALPELHGELAGVLAASGHDAEALTGYQVALRAVLAHGNDNSSVSVCVYRSLLGWHLIKLGRFADALAIVTPSLSAGGAAEAVLRAVEAEGLWGLGRRTEAQAAAQRAIDTASSDEQRRSFSEQLAFILAGATSNA